MASSDDKIITSPQNARIRFVCHLQKKRERDRTGLITIEGVREIDRALRANVDLDEIYFCLEAATSPEARELLQNLRARGVPIVTVGRAAFAKIAYREDSGGFVAIAKRPSTSLDELAADENTLFLVVDAIEKPGNLGALFRSADGAGVTGVILSAPKTDLYNPNAIRASLGTIFCVGAAVSTMQEAIPWLKSRKITIITASPAAETLYTDANMSMPCAVVVGSEDSGLGREWLDGSDLKVRIPMKGSADSLNVSAAATILLYEALRQRQAAGR